MTDITKRLWTILIVLPIFLVAATVTNGYVLSVLWGWFVVPIFGAPALSIFGAMGISVIKHMMNPMPSFKYKKEEGAQTVPDLERKWEMVKAEASYSFAVAFVLPLFWLCIGWVVHQLM